MKTYKETAVYVLERLIAQGGLCYEIHILKDEVTVLRCKYRAVVDGQPRACAAGVCILDEDYLPTMERNSVVVVMEQFPGVIKDHNSEILSKLQRFHDLLARNNVETHLPRLKATLVEIQACDNSTIVLKVLTEIVQQIKASY